LAVKVSIHCFHEPTLRAPRATLKHESSMPRAWGAGQISSRQAGSRFGIGTPKDWSATCRYNVAGW
jgi:hypothetical protein